MGAMIAAAFIVALAWWTASSGTRPGRHRAERSAS